METQTIKEAIKKIIRLQCDISYETGYPCDSIEELVTRGEIDQDTLRLLDELNNLIQD